MICKERPIRLHPSFPRRNYIFQTSRQTESIDFHRNYCLLFLFWMEGSDHVKLEPISLWHYPESISVGCIPPACAYITCYFNCHWMSTCGEGGRLNRSPVMFTRCHYQGLGLMVWWVLRSKGWSLGSSGLMSGKGQDLGQGRGRSALCSEVQCLMVAWETLWTGWLASGHACIKIFLSATSLAGVN